MSGILFKKLSDIKTDVKKLTVLFLQKSSNDQKILLGNSFINTYLRMYSSVSVKRYVEDRLMVVDPPRPGEQYVGEDVGVVRRRLLLHHR